MQKIKEVAYSKVNLALEVLEKKGEYHEVNNLMIPINLYDEVLLEKDDNIYVVDDKIDNNICIKAAKLFFEHFNIKGGVKITLNKNIPLAAGLAGGSTDAASVLKGLVKLYNVDTSDEVLIDLCSELGSDVGFFIPLELAMCTGRGEIVNPIKIERKPIDLILIKVKNGNSTKEIYQNYKYNPCDRYEQIINILRAVEEYDIKALNENIFNDLASVALKLNDQMKNAYDILINNGYNVLVSGSGPTMFVLEKDSEVEKIKKILNDDTVVVIHTTTR